jgi:hypothetical protein
MNPPNMRASHAVGCQIQAGWQPMSSLVWRRLRPRVTQGAAMQTERTGARRNRGSLACVGLSNHARGMTFGWAQLSAVGVVVDWDRHRTRAQAPGSEFFTTAHFHLGGPASRLIK